MNDACCQDGPRRGVFLISLLLTQCIVSARKFTLCPRSCWYRPLRCCKPCRTEIATRTLCFSSVVTICSRMAWGCRLWLSLRAALRERPSPGWITFSRCARIHCRLALVRKCSIRSAERQSLQWKPHPDIVGCDQLWTCIGSTSRSGVGAMGWDQRSCSSLPLAQPLTRAFTVSRTVFPER